MIPNRPYGLGSGARLRRERSAIADAQRRFNAAAADDASHQASSEPTKIEPGRWCGRPPGEVELTLLTHGARALYEGRVVPVRELARLCGVSLRTLYYHVHKQGWTRRRSSVPRDPAKSERQRLRYRAQRMVRPRGLKAGDPGGEARARIAVERAQVLSGAALSKAIARQDAEACARIVMVMTRAMRDLAAIQGVMRKAPRNQNAQRPTPRARGAAGWRPIYVTPLPSG